MSDVRWWPGRAQSVPVEAVVQEIRALESEFGVCQPAALVERARPDVSPLHPLFEWDDSVAAEKHRRTQAREIIGSIRVTFNEVEKTSPAFLSVKLQTESGTKQGYADTVRVLSNKAMREQVVRDALRQLRGWQRRYRMLTELAKVVDAIDRELGEE